MRVSVIATVKNEEDRISEFLDSLLNQARQPDEIVIADGHSTDETPNIIRSYIERHPSIRLIDTLNLSIGEARNQAVKEASNEAIAVVNCDRLDPKWLDTLLTELSSADVAVGVWKGDAKTLFEKCVSELTLPRVSSDEFSPAFFSNCAFRKSVWEKVGGYADSSAGEDTSFAFRLRDHGFRVKRVTDAVVYNRPPKNFQELFWKKFGISKADARLRQLSKFRHHLRRWTVTSLLVFLGVLTLFIPTLLWVLLFSVGTIIGATIFVGVKTAQKLHDPCATLYVPAIIFVNEIGHALGAVYETLGRFFVK